MSKFAESYETIGILKVLADYYSSVDCNSTWMNKHQFKIGSQRYEIRTECYHSSSEIDLRVTCEILYDAGTEEIFTMKLYDYNTDNSKFITSRCHFRENSYGVNKLSVLNLEVLPVIYHLNAKGKEKIEWRDLEDLETNHFQQSTVYSLPAVEECIEFVPVADEFLKLVPEGCVMFVDTFTEHWSKHKNVLPIIRKVLSGQIELM